MFIKSSPRKFYNLVKTIILNHDSFMIFRGRAHKYLKFDICQCFVLFLMLDINSLIPHNYELYFIVFMMKKIKYTGNQNKYKSQ